jgi:hypothetical protein
LTETLLPLHLQLNTSRGIAHPSREGELLGQAIDKGAKAYPLHNPFNADTQALVLQLKLRLGA